MRKAFSVIGGLALGLAACMAAASPAQATVEKPTATFQNTCTAVIVAVHNPYDKLAIDVRVNAGEADGETVEVKPGETYTATIEHGLIGVELKVFGKWRGLSEHEWARPAECDPYTNVTNVCEGLIVIKMVNPASLDAKKVKFTIKIEPADPNVAISYVLEPGKDKTVATTGEGAKVRIKIGAGEWGKWHSWEKPKDCASPSPSPSVPASESPSPGPGGGAGGDDNGATPQLPTTGADGSTLALGGGGAVVLGTLLVGFVLMRNRRNRVTFGTE